MAALRKLTLDEISTAVEGLDGWSLDQGKLHREFGFADFNEAFGFMTRAALIAEAMNHHPEWFNVYNRVVVDLSTHDVDGISESDLELAARMNKLARDD